VREDEKKLALDCVEIWRNWFRVFVNVKELASECVKRRGNRPYVVWKCAGTGLVCL